MTRGLTRVQADRHGTVAASGETLRESRRAAHGRKFSGRGNSLRCQRVEAAAHGWPVWRSMPSPCG
jgi:hypothetical protein